VNHLRKQFQNLILYSWYVHHKTDKNLEVILKAWQNNLLVINNSNNRQDELLKFNWEYKSQAQTNDFRHLWQFNLGYGIGSRGNGIIASASTGIIPGLIFRLKYEKISLLSDGSSFQVEISPTINVRPSLGLGDPRFDNLRNIGGVFIQPFLDSLSSLLH